MCGRFLFLHWFHHINSILQGTTCKISLYQYCSSSCYIDLKALIYQPDNCCNSIKHRIFSPSYLRCVWVAYSNLILIWIFQRAEIDKYLFQYSRKVKANYIRFSSTVTSCGFLILFPLGRPFQIVLHPAFGHHSWIQSVAAWSNT